ncbi:MAG: PAS domain-containing protein [Pseudomonadota bacterium]
MIAELQSAISNAPSRRARLKTLSRVESVKLQVERSALLFRGAPTAIAVSAINAGITAAVAWSTVGPAFLGPWVTAVLVLAGVRASVWLRFRFAKPAGRAMTRFANVHIFFMALNGALWGVLAPLFAVHGGMGQIFLPFVIAGMAAAAIASAGASWRAVLAFNIPALAPLAGTYALTAGSDGYAIAGVVVLFGFATAYLAITVQRMIDRSILLHTHNTSLFDALQKQADEAHLAEQRFRALVESTNDVTLIFSPEGRVIYASPAVSKIFGADPSEMIGMTTKEVVHKDDLPLFRSVGEQSLSTLGEAIHLPHVCMKGPAGNHVAMGGRLTNMLYVPGVEGFVFNGGVLKEELHRKLHAVQ